MLFPHHPAGWDIGVNRWFVGERTALLNDVTTVGSHLAETLTVIAIAVVVVVFLVFRHRYPEAGLIAIGLLLEVTVFVTTTLLVDRQPAPGAPTSTPRRRRRASRPGTRPRRSFCTSAIALIVSHVCMRIAPVRLR